LVAHTKKLLPGLVAGALAVGGLTIVAGTTADAEITAGSYTLNRVLKDDRIRESSGLSRSTYHRRTLFTHNDSGDSARVFAVGRTGRTRAVLTLRGAGSRDWEDMASGPKHSLWLGDIGDNASARSDVTVYRVKEPKTLENRSVRWRKFDLKYPDGAHNAEALLVKPRSGRVFIATKSDNGAGLYRAPRHPSRYGVNRMTRVASGGPRLVTGGAFFPGGKRYVLRTHNWAYVYSHVGDRHPREIRLPDETQGESIDVTRSGSSLLTGSERVHSPVHQVYLGRRATRSTDTSSGDATRTPRTTSTSTSTSTSDRSRYGWAPRKPAEPTNGFVRPERFGARGNGLHDDSAALQRALDRAARVGAKVRLARGKTYLSTRSLDMPSTTFLYGAGRSSVLKFDWRVNDDAHDGYYLGNEDQVDGGNTDITLRDFKVRGAGYGRPAGLKAMQSDPLVPAIRLRLVKRFDISHLEITRAPGISLIYQGSSQGRVKRNFIHNSGRDGINSTWHHRNLHHVVVARNRIKHVGDDAIAVIGAPGQTPNRKVLPHDIVLRDNKIIGWKDDSVPNQLGRGIALLAVTEVTLSHNLIDGTDSEGVLVAGSTRSFSRDPETGEPWRSSHIKVVRNRIYHAGHNGVAVKHSDRVRLRHNVIRYASARRVAMYDCGSCAY
jgi:hypothetical protein